MSVSPRSPKNRFGWSAATSQASTGPLAVKYCTLSPTASFWPFRVHPRGARTTLVVEVVPGIPTAAIPAELNEPRPDVLWWRADRDGHRRPPLGVRDEFRTRIRTCHFIVGGAPTPEPRAQECCVADRPEHCGGRDFACHCPMTRVERPSAAARAERHVYPGSCGPFAATEQRGAVMRRPAASAGRVRKVRRLDWLDIHPGRAEPPAVPERTFRDYRDRDRTAGRCPVTT